MGVNINTYIAMCRARYNISESELAKRLNMSRQSLNAKVHRGTYNSSDLEKIACAFDAELRVSFIDKTTGEPIWNP